MNKGLLKFGVVAAASLMLVGCSGGSSAKNDGTETITFINHKTDWETNGKWDDYIAQFNEKYPDINVDVQTVTDYAGQMKTLMNSDKYGDVLMIPADIKADDYQNFFEPLGKTEELQDTYLGLHDRSYEGVQYGIPTQMNAVGVVINKKVFEDAGITEFPKTPETFIEALKAIKKSNADITPLYTNYASGWILQNFDFMRVSVSGDANFTNEMTADSSPFASGKTMNTIYDLLYNVSKDKLIEADPTTTDWEQSKVDLANGKIGVMVIGSWAVPQIQDLVEDDKSNISFEAFPTTAADGKQYTLIAGDYNLGINIHSDHKKAAKTFIDWLVNDSDYASDNGGLSAVIGGEYPEALKSLQDNNIELIEEEAAPEGKEALFSSINDESQLGIGTTDIEKRRIIDAAIGNGSETFDELMSEFNTRWSDAIKKVTE